MFSFVEFEQVNVRWFGRLLLTLNISNNIIVITSFGHTVITCSTMIKSFIDNFGFYQWSETSTGHDFPTTEKISNLFCFAIFCFFFEIFMANKIDRSEVIWKIAAMERFVKFAQKHLPWSPLLVNLFLILWNISKQLFRIYSICEWILLSARFCWMRDFSKFRFLKAHLSKLTL